MFRVILFQTRSALEKNGNAHVVHLYGRSGNSHVLKISTGGNTTRFANITTKSHGGDGGVGGGSNGKVLSRKERRLQERKAKLEERKLATAKTLGKLENKASTSSSSGTSSSTATVSISEAAAATTSATSSTPFQARVQVWLRGASSGWSAWWYTKEKAIAIAQRLPFALLITGLFLWEETSPYTLVCLRGPSMLPTMAADQSDIWLRSTKVWWKRFGFTPSYKAGDLVGFAHPDHPQHVSCKRVIGVAGDRVARYGQYVHLYVDQDPTGWGITWPDIDNNPAHSWIDRKCSWDIDYCQRDRLAESRRTILVPEGHVWLEADCPGLGIDSRQLGPIPVDWIKGKLVGRLWPFWRDDPSDNYRPMKQRPHPIPLDEETLRQYNVHPMSR